MTVEETPQHRDRKALAAIGDQPLLDLEQRHVRAAPDQAQQIVAMRLDPAGASVAARRRRRNLARGLEPLHPAHCARYAHFEMRGRLIARQPAQDHRLNHALAKIVGKTHPRRPHSRSVNDEAEINQFGNPPTNSIRSDTALGDSLLVMGSLAEREALRGKVQCIYLDPPYGIKFNSNWQPSIGSRDVKDGKEESVSREPEVVRAFRDTWKDGIHSYLSYLRDRLVVAHDVLAEHGSIFVQIGDENVHLVRSLLDETFGYRNLIANITIQKAGSTFARYIGSVADYVLWYAKNNAVMKYREVYKDRQISDDDSGRFTQVQFANGLRSPLSKVDKAPSDARLFAPDPLESAGMGREKGEGAASWFAVELEGRTFRPTEQTRWKTNETGMSRLRKAGRLLPQGKRIRFLKFVDDFRVSAISNIWSDLAGAPDKVYVVQTNAKIIERCVLMTTDPGDLVLDPTCGSGTTAYVAEQWGRRWITIDTSRVALTLARARLMGAKYDYYRASCKIIWNASHNPSQNEAMYLESIRRLSRRYSKLFRFTVRNISFG